jgi:hypothetical protein
MLPLFAVVLNSFLSYCSLTWWLLFIEHLWLFILAGIHWSFLEYKSLHASGWQFLFF